MSSTKTQISRIDFLAREPHHALHARAVYDALPEEARGAFTADPYELLNEHVAVFSYGDLKTASRLHKKVIFGEHGVGMYYNNPHPSYAGSVADRDGVVLRLSPNERHAEMERETLSCPVEVIGVPKMDKWANRKFRMQNRQQTIAISFHWNCVVCPETMSSFEHYKEYLHELKLTFGNVIGHGHPRIIKRATPYYRRAGIRIEEDFEKVMQKADVYVCDNSSTIFEFAFTKKPVVLLNCPAYRKDVVHHGNPRFWEYADIGPQVDSPAELVGAINTAIKEHDLFLPKIDRAVENVFTFTDGKCAARAAAAIMRYINPTPTC
jgi:hypothetical protein